VSVLFASILGLMAQAAVVPTASLCDITRGSFALSTEIEVEGRYFSDFHHGSLLISGDCSVLVDIPRDLLGAQAEAFQEATWRRLPYPNLSRTDVTVRLRGRVHMFTRPFSFDKAPGVSASEVLEVNVREESGE